MGRSLAAILAFALAAPVMLIPVTSRGSDRTLPMQFELRREGPAKACGAKCRVLVFASGAISADTPHDFETFARRHDLAGATVVLDSDGGSVHGAIAFGREIRKLGLDTTVGRVTDIGGSHKGIPRAALLPRANCESMCAFVLVAGVHRTVPPEARVMVHQIWLGDRREDPTAATYSAEDLVLVQRDIGRLVRYTADMGASMELIDLALRIPPWEPMHVMTRNEIRTARVETLTPGGDVTATVASSPPPTALPHPQLLPRLTNGARAIEISERRWAVVDDKGSTALARRHPLTVGGESIGSFDLMVACGAGGSYDVSYVEHRVDGRHTALPHQLGTVSVETAAGTAALNVVSSQRRKDPDELITYASATVPAKLIGAFAAQGDHSMMVTTDSKTVQTAIRLGNTGARQNLPRLAAACRQSLSDRASLRVPRVGGLASAK
ncbi:MAG: hypothetical protein P8Y71_14050 [Pseudolabrys sp.]